MAKYKNKKIDKADSSLLMLDNTSGRMKYVYEQLKKEIERMESDKVEMTKVNAKWLINMLDLVSEYADDVSTYAGEVREVLQQLDNQGEAE